MKIKFWGVRGSIPTPGRDTVRYGGNTPCVEVRPKPDTLFILDAGTGIQRFGEELVKTGKPVKAHIFLTHTHWDHIQGIPFFQPALNEGNELTIVGSDYNSIPLEKIISDQMVSMYFPLQFSELKSKIKFKSVNEGTFEIDGVEIKAIFVNHPGYTLGYRVTYEGKSFVYVSDNEPFNPKNLNSSANKVEKEVRDLFSRVNGNPNTRIVDFARDADVLIHDSMYTPGEYKEKELWGHSDYKFALDIAIQAGVKKFFLYHHGPHHSDDDMDRILEDCRNILKSRNHNLICEAAKEGSTVEW